MNRPLGKLHTIDEAAELLNVSPRTVLRTKEKCPPGRTGTVWLIVQG
jgi:hypothetical protein